MSDSENDSGSDSSKSTSSRRASSRQLPVRAPAVETTDKKVDREEHEEKAASPEAQDSAPDRISTGSPVPNPAEHDLVLEWQSQEPSQKDDSDDAQATRLIDFVVVPGVYGDWDAGVGDSPGSGTSAWVPKFAGKQSESSPSDLSSSDCRVLRFKYDSAEIYRGSRSRQAIHRLALKLLQGLEYQRRTQTKKRLIYFIAHDLGGIIVKDALITAALKSHDWVDISQMSRVLIFSACPHRCSSAADLQDRLTRFLFETYKQDREKARPAASSIPGLAEAISQINGLFIDSKVPLRSWIVNLHSKSEGPAGIHNVFDNFTGTLGLPLEVRLPEPSEPDYRSLTKRLKTLESDVIATVQEAQHRHERKLLTLASPVYPLKSEERSNPLQHLEDYQTWLNSSAPRVLYIHGSGEARDVAEQVFYSLEKKTDIRRRAMVLYFSFNSRDVRCDSIRDMIATFIAQIANHYPQMTGRLDRFFIQLHNEHGWTEADLVYFFERFRTTDEVEQTMIVINHFDECTKGSRKTFLDNIIARHQQGESPWRIVVTSNKPGALSEELSGSFCVPIDLSTLGHNSLALNSVESDLEQLAKMRPDLSSEKERMCKEIQFLNGLDPCVRNVVREQALLRGDWGHEISLAEIFGSLSLTKGHEKSQETLREVSHWVMRRFPDKVMLRRLLAWLLYAVRPLTVWELATVLAFNTEADGGQFEPNHTAVANLISNIQTWFAGIIEIDHNEVKFTSTRLHTIMRTGGDPQEASGQTKYLWDEIRHTAHAEITNLCLEYLSRSSVQKALEEMLRAADVSTAEAAFSPDRTNLVSYAVQAWTHHYSLSSPAPDLSTLEFQPGLLKSLASGHWLLSNPITRRVTCSETMFPLFLGLGIPGAVKPQDKTDAFQGLLEAARKGQNRIVRDLLDEYDILETQLWEVLQASGTFGDEEMMLSVLDRIIPTVKNTDDIQWPPVLIYRACWLGLDRFVDRILKLGCPVDPEVEWRTTMQASPLTQAARMGHTKVVRLLLEHNASMEFKSAYERNALHLAASIGHTEVVRMMVEDFKVKVDWPSEQNFTSLYLAAVFGHYKTTEQLLDAGADPNMGMSSESPNLDQWTPLVVATDDGFQRCVQLLLDRGANPNMSGPGGPPLRWAVIQGHLEIFNALLAAGADPKSSDFTELPLVIECVGWGFKPESLAMLERLLELGLDVNAKGSIEGPALVYVLQCCSNERFEDGTYEYEPSPHRERAVQMLLEHGADPNVCTVNGETALHHAAVQERYEVVQMLLEKGADPNVMSKLGNTPLFDSLRRADVARLLLEKGANPNVVLSHGWTNLTYAANYGLEECVRLLLEYGAAVDLAYGEGVEAAEIDWLKGWTALRCAGTRDHSAIVRLLAEAGADMQHTVNEIKAPVIHSIAHSNTLSTFLEFLSRVDVNQVDTENWTPLHYSGVPLDNVKRLVNAGANLEIANSRGDTPLTSCVCWSLEQTKYLVDKGANIHHVSPYYGSALDQACRNANLEMVKFLVEKGADVNQVCGTITGTPLQALCVRYVNVDSSSAEEIARYLLDEEESDPHVRPKSRRADVTLRAGILGYAINAAALMDQPNIINLILDQEGGTVDVKDDAGRMPIHLAAFNGIVNFEAILDRGGDIHVKDKLGRTALHHAAHGSRLQAVERIMSLLDDKTAVNDLDLDGWTPLCWAARGPASGLDEQRASEPAAQAAVIRLLLENGADVDTVITVGDEKWTAVTIARYHQCSPEVVSLLSGGSSSKPASGQKEAGKTSDAAEVLDESGKKPRWKIGLPQTGWCDACQADIMGFSFTCKSCPWLWYCFKCHPHASILHNPEHEYKKNGAEEYREETAGEAASAASSSSNSDDSDSDSDTS